MTSGLKLIMGLCAAACLAGIAAALQLWGAIEVRSNPGAILGLTFIGALWILLVSKIFPWLGLSFEYDIIDGRNTSAAIAFSGAVLAAAILYAGGSLGEGPSYLENFFSAGLGTVTWLTFWLLLEISAGMSVSITEERDLGSGVRMSGFLVAAALILGRALAGNWESVSATLRDFFHDGWPALALLVVAWIIERLAKPSRSRPFPPWEIFGGVPATLNLAFAVAWVWHLGRWEGMP
jgi:uncharacterized membrane protein YjfL (UPF0719 family)